MRFWRQRDSSKFAREQNESLALLRYTVAAAINRVHCHGILHPLEQFEKPWQRAVFGRYPLQAWNILNQHKIGLVILDESTEVREQGNPKVFVAAASVLLRKRLARRTTAEQNRSFAILFHKLADAVGSQASDVFLIERRFGEICFESGSRIRVEVECEYNFHARVPQAGTRASATRKEIENSDGILDPLSLVPHRVPCGLA